jgi:RimJ/RimL family protein N-acetyltransferase
VSSSPPWLEGPRIRLEPLSLAHLPALAKVAFDDRIWRYMNQRITTPAELRGWADASLRLQGAGMNQPWAIVLRQHNRVVGSTRFIDLDERHKTVEIGNTWLSPTVHGSGINPEAKLLQLTYAFEDLKLNRVAFKTHHENLQSQAALRKLGAQHEGTFRNHYIMPDGTQRHSVWFSITKEDWPQVKDVLHRRLNDLV